MKYTRPFCLSFVYHSPGHCYGVAKWRLVKKCTNAAKRNVYRHCKSHLHVRVCCSEIRACMCVRVCVHARVCVCVYGCQMCMSEYAWWKNKQKGIVANQKQPLGAVWCKTRLFNSGGQFDQHCNLTNGVILARALCERIGELSSPMAMGVPRSKVWMGFGGGGGGALSMDMFVLL